MVGIRFSILSEDTSLLLKLKFAVELELELGPEFGLVFVFGSEHECAIDLNLGIERHCDVRR